jgi:hypothetical protein
MGTKVHSEWSINMFMYTVRYKIHKTAEMFGDSKTPPRYHYNNYSGADTGPPLTGLALFSGGVWKPSAG